MADSDVQIRPEEPGDRDAVHRVNESAFERDAEADMVDALRTAGAVVSSLVAVVNAEQAWGRTIAGGEVIGHALVTPVTVATEHGEMPLLGLGPVAVLPAHQRQGVGTRLVETCLERLRTDGHAGIVVVGHPAYYPRFGFIPAGRWGLVWDGQMPDEAFMALELTPGRLAGVRGVVRFRPEFDGV